jgi:succinate dehydrogenase / fumarate reductase, cytochrome b subunit
VLSRATAPRMDRNAPWWPSNYRAGAWAFVLHRATGLALAGYLFAHIWVISFAAVSWGGLSFDRLMELLESPLIKTLELGLILLVLVHGLNGVRILLFDIGVGVRRQRQLFLGALGISIILCLLAAGYTIVHLQQHS